MIANNIYANQIVSNELQYIHMLLNKFKGANMLEKQIFHSLLTFLFVVTKY